jgi:DNA-binding MurR/RpiR family transcriptional regulator
MNAKIQNVQINALSLAYNLYLSGDGLTHAVRQANARIANITRDSGKQVEPAMMLANHQLYYQVKKANKVHGYNKILAPEQINLLKRDRERGYSVSGLAEKYGVSMSTVYKYLKSK